MTIPSGSTHLILDTDIGSDVDDAMALIQLIGSGWSEHMSITTVYGDTNLRAKIAARYCELSQVSIPIFAGEGTPLSGKPVWVSGMEGSLHQDLSNLTFETQGAVDHILKMSQIANKDLVILAIGPLTNIAKACLSDPKFPNRVKTVFMMGGNFAEGRPEHNFISDVTATRVVLESGLKIILVGLESTKRISLPNDAMRVIAESGSAGEKLYEEILQWSQFWNATWNVPHDPVAVLMLTHPELFKLAKPGTIEFVESGELAGSTKFNPARIGNHQIVLDFEERRISSAIVDGITSISSQGLLT